MRSRFQKLAVGLFLLVLTALSPGCGDGGGLSLGSDAPPPPPTGAPPATLTANRTETNVQGAVGPITVNLSPGWNGIGFQGYSMTSLGTNPAVPGFAEWDGNTYQFRAMTMAQINAGDGCRRGIWVYATQATSFTYSGSDADGGTLNLRQGWNLVNFPGNASMGENAFNCTRNGQQVQLRNTIRTQLYEINGNNYAEVDLANGGQVRPGRAYWMFCHENQVQLRYGNGGPPQPSPSPATSPGGSPGPGPGPSPGTTPTPAPSPSQPTATIILQHVLARAVPTEVINMKILGQDSAGAVVFGPQQYPKQTRLELTVPTTLTKLTIDYTSANATIAHYSTTVSLTPGAVLIINDPDITILSGVAVYVQGRMEAPVNPSWFAYQDGANGPWTVASPTDTGLYSLSLSAPDGKYAVAVVAATSSGSGGESASSQMNVLHATVAEAPSLTVKTELEPSSTGGGGGGGGGGPQNATILATTGNITVSGAVSGLAAGENGRLTLTSAKTLDLLQNGPYEITGLLPGRYSVVALKGANYLQAGAQAINKMIISALNLKSGTFTLNLDFDGANAKVPVDASFTLAGALPGETLNGTVGLGAIRETAIPVSWLQGAIVNYKGYPFTSEEEHDVSLRQGDPGGGGPPSGGGSGGGRPEDQVEGVHVLRGEALGVILNGATPFRSVDRWFGTPVNATETFLASAFTGSASLTSATWSAYAGAQAYTLTYVYPPTGEATTVWAVGFSPGWLGATPTFAYTLPSFASLAGYSPTWNVAPGSFWSLSAASGEGLTLSQLMLGVHEGSDGMVRRAAGQQGTLTQ